MTSWCSAKVKAIWLSSVSSRWTNSPLLLCSTACRRSIRSAVSRCSLMHCAIFWSRASRRPSTEAKCCSWARCSSRPCCPPRANLSMVKLIFSSLHLHQQMSQCISCTDIGRTPSAWNKTARVNSARLTRPLWSVSINWIAPSSSRCVKSTSMPASKAMSLGNVLRTSSRVASPLSSTQRPSKNRPHFAIKRSRMNSFSALASSRRNSFFSNMLSLMTPVNKAIMPKLPMMTKLIRNTVRSGLSSKSSPSSMYIGIFGDDINTKSVNIEVRMSAKCL
mmetsp:Transcript_35032/g.100873  ORF Transcript_35032/g.100873 Transcript_35032/m.100873 type:complete len:277 (+) Transcript_35032:518-1348(+)